MKTNEKWREKNWQLCDERIQLQHLDVKCDLQLKAFQSHQSQEFGWFFGCGWLWLVMAGCGWLWLAIVAWLCWLIKIPRNMNDHPKCVQYQQYISSKQPIATQQPNKPTTEQFRAIEKLFGFLRSCYGCWSNLICNWVIWFMRHPTETQSRVAAARRAPQILRAESMRVARGCVVQGVTTGRSWQFLHWYLWFVYFKIWPSCYWPCVWDCFMWFCLSVTWCYNLILPTAQHNLRGRTLWTVRDVATLRLLSDKIPQLMALGIQAVMGILNHAMKTLQIQSPCRGEMMQCLKALGQYLADWWFHFMMFKMGYQQWLVSIPDDQHGSWEFPGPTQCKDRIKRSIFRKTASSCSSCTCRQIPVAVVFTNDSC